MKGSLNFKSNTVDMYITLLFTGEDDIFTVEDLATLETFIARRLNITTEKNDEGTLITITKTVNKPQVDAVSGFSKDWFVIAKNFELESISSLLDEIQQWLIWKQG